ncbi:MAG: hypothetical protein Q7S88_01830 [Candidatus Daviesbacteria bacterium]|nr:hypothetical protein [Candidatus Daviesbacteria bacterium]
MTAELPTIDVPPSVSHPYTEWAGWKTSCSFDSLDLMHQQTLFLLASLTNWAVEAVRIVTGEVEGLQVVAFDANPPLVKQGGVTQGVEVGYNFLDVPSILNPYFLQVKVEEEGVYRTTPSLYRLENITSKPGLTDPALDRIALLKDRASIPPVDSKFVTSVFIRPYPLHFDSPFPGSDLPLIGEDSKRLFMFAEVKDFRKTVEERLLELESKNSRENIKANAKRHTEILACKKRLEETIDNLPKDATYKKDELAREWFQLEQEKMGVDPEYNRQLYEAYLLLGLWISSDQSTF